MHAACREVSSYIGYMVRGRRKILVLVNAVVVVTIVCGVLNKINKHSPVSPSKTQLSEAMLVRWLGTACGPLSW